jgi:PAS domain S-box-containing protein
MQEGVTNMKAASGAGANLGFLDFTYQNLEAGVLVSLLSVWVLVGLFTYLNRFTRRRYFTIWTVAWLFYALWLTLNLSLRGPWETEVVLMLKQDCISISAVFLLWGSMRFLGNRVRQTLLALFLGFLFIWSGVGAYVLKNPLHFMLPVFILIGSASTVTAYGFWQYRRRRDNIGAGLLSIGFFLWGAYLAIHPFAQQSHDFISAGFFISAVLQLFIAVSMIILVLEQMRFINQRRAQNRIQQQQVEKALLQHRMISTEERYRTLFEQASEPILIAAVEDLRLLEVNQAAERLLGISPADVGRVSLTLFCPIADTRGKPPATGEEWFRYICEQSPFNLIRKNGSVVPIEANGAIIDLAGRPAYQFFLMELTDQSRLEHQLRQAEKYSALGQMISGVAHELNNPLAVINGYLELILAHHPVPAPTKTALAKVVQESSRATRLIRNFLSFAREQPGHRRMVDMNEFIHRLVELRKFDFSVGNIHLTLDLDPHLSQTFADPDQVQQVLVNLVNNALQAMLDQQGPHCLRIQTKRQDKSLIVQVEDNGPGVPKNLESKIFEPLFTTKKPGVGTGLGLSIAHSIMTEHQGRITYLPSSLGGACFALEFPIVAPTSYEGMKEPEAELPPGLGDTLAGEPAAILVVDDEEPVAELLGETLGSIGCKATICTDASKALELLQVKQFELVITDIRMPNMDGREFFNEAVRRQPELTRRFILFTGDVVNSETQAFLTTANVPYLTKPFELDRVKRLVREILIRLRTNRPPPKTDLPGIPRH